MEKEYRYSTLKDIYGVVVKNQKVWKERVENQTRLVHLLERLFGAEMTNRAFSFYPGRIYFSTPLTSSPAYTEKTRPLWQKIKNLLVELGYQVYAPFEKTDPHARVPDNLSSFEIAELDHVQVLTAEAALMDLNVPSHGVGQEIELGIFLPVFSFAKGRVSRMIKGTPGTMVFSYKNEKELLKILRLVFRRKSYRQEPFYLGKCRKHKVFTIFKGKTCLFCRFQKFLHPL